MLKVLVGDLFESRAQTLVNTVNCVGVMGKGIALEFKKRFPEMFRDYAERCERQQVKMGRPYLYRRLLPPWILNFPTKDHWRSVTRLGDIIEGLEYLVNHYQAWGITSLAVPPLGCGHGQLEWGVVGPVLYGYLRRMSVDVELYAPYGTPHAELQPDFLGRRGAYFVPGGSPGKWIKPAYVAIVEVLSRIEREPYHWPVGRTMFQKIAYVATEEGLPTGLVFEKRSFGPFSPDLKRVITRLVNNGLIREERVGPMMEVKIGVTFKHARALYETQLREWEDTIARIADLFMRTDRKRAELVGTVLFTARRLIGEDRACTERDVLDVIKAWKIRRKPPLTDDDIALTIRNLAALGWLDLLPSEDLPLPEDAWLNF